jgi:hypothetical protein
MMDKDKLKSDITWVIGTVTGGIMLILIIRGMIGGDAGVRLRMRAARAVSRTAKAQVDMWTHVAGAADTAYMNARNSIL